MDLLIDVTNGFANREWNTFSSSFPLLIIRFLLLIDYIIYFSINRISWKLNILQ